MQRLILSFLIICIGSNAMAQASRTDLEKQRAALQESIDQTKQQLAAITNNKQATLSQLRALQQKLSVRQKLISNINQEIGSIDNSIHSSATEINQLQQTLEQQQIRYAQSVRYSYRYRNSYDMLAFLFSAGDFNDALRRMKYLKRYRDYRSEQLEQIRVTQGKIHNTINTLNTQKSEKTELLNTQQGQTEELKKETDETNSVVKQLKGRETELNAQIEKNQKTARNINQQINRLIQHEIEVARKKAEDERKRLEEEKKRQAQLAAQQAATAQQANNGYNGVNLNTGSGRQPQRQTASANQSTQAAQETKPDNRTSVASAPEAALDPRKLNSGALQANSYRMTLTPDVGAISDNFEANRGRLPWPVEKGYISLRFGRYHHPTAGDVWLENYGINIDTSPNAGIRSVFEGKVTSILSIAGSGWTVLVQHGIYFTVYTGLSSVSVRKDQQVHLKQNIGTVGLNEEGIPQLGFQVWKAAAKVDPEQWIAR